MFERYLTDALITHFGHVVENLDADKVRLSAWNGQVVLEDLSLRKNALESFVTDCPVEIAYGKVGNLELKIPWKLFKSQLQRRHNQTKLLEANCAIILTDVDILITPRREAAKSGSESEEDESITGVSLEQRRSRKEKQVQSLLDADLLQRVTNSTGASRWSWVQDWLSNLLSTLSVTVRNIHIRYEDPGTSMGYVWSSSAEGTAVRRYRTAFSVGITLQQFSIETTETGSKMEAGNGEDTGDSLAKQGDTKNLYETSHKTAAGENLAIYWDSHCELMSINAGKAKKFAPGSDNAAYFQSSFQILNGQDDYFFEHATMYTQDHAYLLDPISPTINLNLVSSRKDTADESTNDTIETPPSTELAPPSSFNIDLPPCKFILSRSTLEDTAYIRKSLSVWNQAKRGFLPEASLRRLARLKPMKSPRKDPQGWWVYANEATIAFLRVQRAGNDMKNFDFYRKRRRGWVGLVQALSRRRKYVAIYKDFLASVKQKDHDGSLRAHQSLLALEDQLLPREIVAFRISLYDSMDTSDDVATATSRPGTRKDNSILTMEHRAWMMDEMMQALEREKTNMKDRARAGQRRASIQLDQNKQQMDVVVWSASFVCRQFTLQINDQVITRSKEKKNAPIIRISSAWTQDHRWYEDGSWDTDCVLASLTVQDLTLSRSSGLRQSHFTNLVGRKQEGVNSSADDFILINGIRYSRSLSIVVCRKLEWISQSGILLYDDDERGSTTKIQVRILPMEIVYSTLPVEGLSRVLATIKTPELVDDIHRMASAAHDWRERQKRKLLQALAHKHKKIVVDVDVGSPELLIPEDIDLYNCPILAVDLGRLQITHESPGESEYDFDDRWNLVLSNIQVRSTTASMFLSQTSETGEARNVPPHQLVEPFSLDFAIFTKIAGGETQVVDDVTRVHISATLPRLAFNLTSSAMRLVLRLNEQWARRKRETTIRRAAQTMPQSLLAFESRRSLAASVSPSKRKLSHEFGTLGANTPENKAISRVTQFQFSAPLIALRVSNDVDGRDGMVGLQRDKGNEVGSTVQTPLVDLAFRGIRGKYLKEEAQNGDSTTTFTAQLYSLGAIDLYQKAGKDFSLLLSSVPEENLPEDLLSRHSSDSNNNDATKYAGRRKDLVAIEYRSDNAITRSAKDSRTEVAPDVLSIWFHELYIQWNPETLAAIQKALRLSPSQCTSLTRQRAAEKESEASLAEDEHFFDAEEDEFFDAGSGIGSGMQSLSVASSSTTSIRIDSGGLQALDSPRLNFFLPPSNAPLSPISPFFSSLSPRQNEALMDMELQELQSRKPFKVMFELSKLRVSFNKEARHRKLMTAQMEGTSFSYTASSNGGSRTAMRMENLVFSDPDSFASKSLYAQIIGLKPEPETSGESVPSSLLEMDILVNPAVKNFTSDNIAESEESKKGGVRIDRERGRVLGCNNFIKARFSPMRFVFLEQLWFEILDYFFEGIIGAEIWGGQQATQELVLKDMEKDLLELPSIFIAGSDAAGFNFTKFDISLESPALLFPVTYQSPQFIHLQLSNIHVSNHYDSCVIRDDPGMANPLNRLQWYNNCDIAFQGLRLYSWSGRELGKTQAVADVALRWPVGPLAHRIVPKWNVACRFDNLDIALRRSEYALLQHIVSFNIGELSRHLDEWEALQSIPKSHLEKYQKTIMVNYGYDKKDVAPTTYDVRVTVPLLSFSLIVEKDADKTMAIARCMDFLWTLRKEADLVVMQKLTCDVELVTPSAAAGYETMLSMSKYDTNISSEGITSQEMVPELTYTSTTQTSGDNVKTLEIVDPCIYMIVPAWSAFMEFFQALPDPEVLSAPEIRSMIKVGDRWYRIGEGGAAGSQNDFENDRGRELAWIADISEEEHVNVRNLRSSTSRHAPKFQLRISLTWPRIILASTFVPSTRVILRMHHLDYLNTNDGQKRKVFRSFFFHDVEVYTVSTQKPIHRINEDSNSLIHPWSVVGLLEKCNGESVGDCAEHTLQVSGDVLQARAAYSDIIIAIDVCISILYSTKDGVSTVHQGGFAKSRSSESLSLDSTDSSYSEANLETELFCKLPHKNVYNIALDGFELKVADDSGRHFAGTQDLIILSLGKFRFCHEGLWNGNSSIRVRLDSLDLYDCLQDDKSPFRTAASSRSGVMGLRNAYAFTSSESPSIQKASNEKMTWDEYSLVVDENGSFKVSPILVERACEASAARQTKAEELIEIICLFSEKVRQNFTVRLRSFAVQWNPSTIIAIQRFVGRLRKDSKMKATQMYHAEFDGVVSTPSMKSSQRYLVNGSSKEVGDLQVHATIEVDSLTVCLNKEHQHRRLVELTLSACRIALDSSEEGLCVDGELGDLYAWDSDNYRREGLPGAAITTKNRNILQVQSALKEHRDEETGQEVAINHPFLQVRYKTFEKRLSQERILQEVPNWVLPHVSESGEINDFLSVSVAAVQVTYLLERTEEILDYLSNGLPGKGMGATSRAAKGFIEKRILTKSFLELSIDSPQIVVPQHECLHGGIMLKLGDVNMKSWFEQVIESAGGRPSTPGKQDDWWRMLSLQLTGFCAGMMRNKTELNDLSSATKPINLEIMLQKPTVRGREIAVQGKLSFFDLKLNYSDFVFLRAVIRDNIGRKIDTEAWDNIEKAYWLEEDMEEDRIRSGTDFNEVESRQVEYSSNARFVRYGKAGKRDQKKQTNSPATVKPPATHEIADSSTGLDVRFQLDGLSLKLSRDDDVEGMSQDDDIATAFQYDIMLLRVQLVEIAASRKETGDLSFCLSLFRLGLFDLGDRGRLMRQRYYSSLPSMKSIKAKQKAIRQPCPFHVLVEGYSPLENAGSRTMESSADDPQFVVNVDRCSAGSAVAAGSLKDCELPLDAKVTVAKVVINNLSVNALVRPFKEIAAFLSCEWRTKASQELSAIDVEKNESFSSETIVNTKPANLVVLQNQGLQLKLVAHYPRVFFLADESDPHSRALVLRGLAVVDLSKISRVQSSDVVMMNALLSRNDTRHITSLNAQLYSMESYINPDVDEALGFKMRHVQMVGETHALVFPVLLDESLNRSSHTEDTLGVALIQPVTTGVEYSELRHELFPTKRSLYINVEPVSTMVSFEDLRLIETIANRWSSKRQNTDKIKATPVTSLHGTPVDNLESRGAEKETYDIEFSSERLGLGLKAEAGQIVVIDTHNSEYSKEIGIGDTLVAIEGQNFKGSSLDKVVRHLSICKRPSTVTFERLIPALPLEDTPTTPSNLSKEENQNSPGVPGSPLDQNLLASSEATSTAHHFAMCYDVRFRLGMSRGLELEHSLCGRFPVVTKILTNFPHATHGCSIDESNAEEIEATLPAQKEIRVPRNGAVIVALNGTSVEELGVEEAFRRLESLSFEGAERNTYSSISDILQSQVYWLSFMEVDSEVWGKVEEVDISTSGIAFSFIDDLNGRDMPLFRAKLSTVKVHLERGMGVEARILDSSPPSLLKLGASAHCRDNEDRIALSQQEITEFQSEAAVTVSILAMCAIDYFHPRIACWEPLMEPSQLYLLFEMQKGTKRRPGQIAVELSDYLLHDQVFRGGISNANMESQMLTVNVTDAAAQVFVKASSQWKEWRRSIVHDSDDENNASIEEDVVSEMKSLSIDTSAKSNSINQDIALGRDIVPHSDDQALRYQQAKKFEAQRAAQAALVFATKRGADKREGASAKPFVFRNRTGVSIAFVQQGRTARLQKGLNKPQASVGEYAGLEDYDPQAVIEIADKEDAKFSMELLSDQDIPIDSHGAKANKQGSNKIRDYEGRFPSLTVSIQAVSGVSVEPVTNLQVYKVGSKIRHLIVKKESDSADERAGRSQYSIPVVWKVEIEDNRRILTLSTAVRVVSSGFNTPIEVGVKKELQAYRATETPVTSIGIARPETPFYLPLWLALKLDPVYVYVRPGSEERSDFCWGQTSVLHFGPFTQEVESENDSSEIGRWIWKETFRDLTFVECNPTDFDSSTAWLSVFCISSSASGKTTASNGRKANEARTDKSNHGSEDDFTEVITVTVDSGLTLRNMLPMTLDWEVANTVGTDRKVVDGSTHPSKKHVRERAVFTFDGEVVSHASSSLESGQCTEVFASDFCSQELEARFMGSSSTDWSTWAPLSILDDLDKKDDQAEDQFEDVLAAMVPRARQVNVQVHDDRFGVPLTFGVRIVPKMTLPDDPYYGRVYGLEVIIYAELWIRNITSLPLNFGGPSYQLHEPGKHQSEGFSLSDESLARFTAESALMEIANLLEVGDKGTGLRNKGTTREVGESGGIESLPCQECDQIVEEVFEYIEIDSSTVKRRWWASESYDSYRENLTQSSEEHQYWEWVDESWAIDCVGHAKARYGGWESCRALFTAAGSFSGTRDFDPAHTFRRRRYFRARTGHRFRQGNACSPVSLDTHSVHPAGALRGGIQAMHQPLTDSFSREQRKLRRKQDRKSGKANEEEKDKGEEEKVFKIAVKCGDSTWCSPVTIPSAGTSNGVIRVLASRWPTLTRAHVSAPEGPSKDGERLPSIAYDSGCLDSDLFELCYSISDVEGEWGEFSRSMIVSPRFLLRNDSESLTIEVKQAGAPDSSLSRLAPHQVKSFYWSDFRLPGLVSVRPLGYSNRGEYLYRWSGGFDICNLGMVPLRVRQFQASGESKEARRVQSLRAIVEVRPGTGGTGINVSFKEEDLRGNGSLFRIENLSTFPIWLAQDGNLANPLATATISERAKYPKSHGWVEDHTQFDGDLIRPNEKFPFALDVPYRQGKYAHRKEASMAELMRIRVALAPLSSRAGIETMKVVGLTTVGESLRLNPSKIVGPFVSSTRDALQQIRILGVVTNDGPTLVLKFILISKPAPDVFRNAFEEVSYMSTTQSRAKERLRDSGQRDFTREIMDAALATAEGVNSQELPSEDEAKRNAMLGDGGSSLEGIDLSPESSQFDEIYSFRAEFGGFVFSFVDSVPSEIAVASMRNVNALARWNKLRTTDASVIVSVGWVQVDNHVPSAPFKVAVRPDKDLLSTDELDSNLDEDAHSAPLLVVALAFAPKHKSGIVCLRSVTVAPRNLIIALDLAFLVRLQRFQQGVKGHFRNLEDTDGARTGAALLYTEQKRYIMFPHFDPPEQILERAASFGSENQKLYFQGLTILPCNINLSVAPARALTPAQAALEGTGTAAIHEAVRKGDVLVGSSSALLGVRVGRKNKTPLSVVRGVFKSIVVDALLRLDDASLNFSGVALRNHISTGPQLTTFLLTHYLVSLRQNVPALLGSLAAFGNPLGLIRGVGEGVSDFVNEPVKGLKKSVKELDPTFLVDGVARGTESLARHTVGGVADSASLLTETFSKNMAVLTLDRRYAQKRDRDKALWLNNDGNLTLAGGVESGFTKLFNGFRDGVTGVVKAPMRGAEKRGFEGFAKGVGKGILGLMVKPIIGISDAATDVMIGVKSTVEKTTVHKNLALEQNQLRPRRPMYGRDKVVRPFKLEDSAAATLMLRTSCAGENYLSHMDMKNRVALFSVTRFILLGSDGKELMALKYEQIAKAEVDLLQKEDDSQNWGIEMALLSSHQLINGELNGEHERINRVPSIYCQHKQEAVELCSQIKQGMDLIANDNL